MNRYKVTLTAMLADSRDYEVEAENKAKAWDAAEDMMMLDLPNLDEIRRDEIELIAMDTFPGNEPEPDALTQARELIDRLLDAADHGAIELDSLSVDAIPDDDIQAELSDPEAFKATHELRTEYERRAKDAWQAIKDARAFLANKPASAPAATPEPAIGAKVLLQVEARADTDNDEDVEFPAPSEWVVIGRRLLPGKQGLGFTLGHESGATIFIDQTDVVNGRYPWMLLP